MRLYNTKLVKVSQRFSGKNVLLLGFGREGRDTFRFLQARFPGIVLGIADKDPTIGFGIKKFKLQNAKCKMTNQNSKLYLGERYLDAIKKYDVIIKSPGIPPKLVEPFLKGGQRLTSATEIFFENCQGSIIGVTGTKGKSTTSAMIYWVLKKAGLRAHLVGNIGKPALSELLRARSNDIFVYELSSHQLYGFGKPAAGGLKKSPHVAVFLNIYPEHLDYYRNFKEYANAKANICRWQTKKDYLVYNSRDKHVNSFAKKSKAKKIPIEGRYYELDREAARAVGKIFGIPHKTIEDALKTFKPLAHRLELVGTFREITFYNDSLATIPQTTIEALDFLGSRVETLVAGGHERGVDFTALAARIRRSNIKTLILFPPSGERIAKEVLARQKLSPLKQRLLSRDFHIFFVQDMKTAVQLAFAHTAKGKICLLSPASASFGLFRDYKDRGEQFKKYIRQYKNAKAKADI